MGSGTKTHAAPAAQGMAAVWAGVLLLCTSAVTVERRIAAIKPLGLIAGILLE